MITLSETITITSPLTIKALMGDYELFDSLKPGDKLKLEFALTTTSAFVPNIRVTNDRTLQSVLFRLPEFNKYINAVGYTYNSSKVKPKRVRIAQ